MRLGEKAHALQPPLLEPSLARPRVENPRVPGQASTHEIRPLQHADFEADPQSECARVAESPGLQEVHAGGGTRTPDTRIMIATRVVGVSPPESGSRTESWLWRGVFFGSGRLGQEVSVVTVLSPRTGPEVR
jgi:hypothetical protein